MTSYLYCTVYVHIRSHKVQRRFNIRYGEELIWLPLSYFFAFPFLERPQISKLVFYMDWALLDTAVLCLIAVHGILVNISEFMSQWYDHRHSFHTIWATHTCIPIVWNKCLWIWKNFFNLFYFFNKSLNIISELRCISIWYRKVIFGF